MQPNLPEPGEEHGIKKDTADTQNQQLDKNSCLALLLRQDVWKLRQVESSFRGQQLSF